MSCFIAFLPTPTFDCILSIGRDIRILGILLYGVFNTIRGEDLAGMVQFLIGSVRVDITDGESAPAAAVQRS